MEQNKYKIEVCTNSVQSAIEAEKGGASRIELCDNLYEGGTTPSAASIEITCSTVKIPVYVIIRPRGGDFLYSALELCIMERDIVMAAELGAAGVVLGLLNNNGTVDVLNTKKMVDLAKSKGLGVTFHRAFDMSNDFSKALEDIISTGCERILTSGSENKAMDGKILIASLVKQAAGRISIMAGSGINANNVETLVKSTGIKEVHLSGKHLIEGGMKFRNTKIRMGGLPEIPEYQIAVTNAIEIRKVYNALDVL